LPRLVFAGKGVGAYSDEKEAFAGFALVDDLELRGWSFPADPTVVARRVVEVSGTRGGDSPCTSEKIPQGGPYPTGYFVGEYRVEVVPHGSFFVPAGKNVFNCAGEHRRTPFLCPEMSPASSVACSTRRCLSVRSVWQWVRC
jgi:hypothetical protein